jgi:hypothetical protein
MGGAEWGVGCQVSGLTSLGESFSGEVFSYDAGMGLAVLRTKGNIINTHDVRILRVEGVKDLRSVSPAEAPPLKPLPVVDEARCQKREEASLKAAHASAGAWFRVHALKGCEVPRVLGFHRVHLVLVLGFSVEGRGSRVEG